MYSYNLKYKVESPENEFWESQIHNTPFKHSQSIDEDHHNALIEGATKYLQALHPLKAIHLDESGIESLDVKQELD